MRGVIKFLFGAVIILAIAWLGLWWYAEGRMQSGITDWADQLATQGWKISYDGLKRGTSPGAAKLTLTNLTLSPPPDAEGRTVTVTLPTLALRVAALDPFTLHTDLPNRLAVSIGPDIDAAVTFTAVSLTEQLDPQILFNNGAYPYRSGNFSAAGVDVLASEGSLLVLHIDNIGINGALNPAAGPGDLAFTGTESFDGIALSPLMTHLLSIPFGGRIAHVALSTTISGPVPPGLQGLAAQLKALPVGDQAGQQKLLIPVIHKWAEAGGHGSVSLGATIGPTTLNSGAMLKFDANLQPQGTADLTANHLDQFFATVTNAYPQVQNQVAQIMAQLSAYIGSTPQDGQTLTVHALYGGGAVSINGQKVAPLPPVDWTSLENPQAPPPQAPGDGSGAAQ